MTRHPATEGNDLKPKRVDAQEDVTAPDGAGGRVSVSRISANATEKALLGTAYAPGYAGGDR